MDIKKEIDAKLAACDAEIEGVSNPFPARYEEMLLGFVYSSSLLLYVKER